jgi:hypothetical protein
LPYIACLGIGESRHTNLSSGSVVAIRCSDHIISGFGTFSLYVIDRRLYEMFRILLDGNHPVRKVCKSE